MSSTTVGEQARRLQITPELLLEQLAYAGVNKTDVNDELTDTDQTKLLGYLQRLHGNVSGEPRVIKTVRSPKTLTKIKPTDSNGQARTIQVEVRKKRTFITRDRDSLKVEKLRIERIQAKAFKAFRSFDFELKGRNLLAYGANGAGKSSLYWLLYTFLQSGQKSFDDSTKYFEPDVDDNLLNIHATKLERGNAYINVSLKSVDSSPVEYALSTQAHETENKSEITKGNLASDFLTYRTLFNFYNFSNSKIIDLWPVFEKEILPFLNTTNPAEPNLGNAWQAIQNEYASVFNALKKDRSKKAVAFDGNVDQFNQYLEEALSSITQEAQKFYDKHFKEKTDTRLSLRLGLRQLAAQFDPDVEHPVPPQIGFEIKIGDTAIKRPHTFLNEAKLTQLALSVRFGATLANLQESPLKLLVIDDLLISLDMNNRIPVVDIILGDDFKDYQKIILTHDIGFFKEFRRRIGLRHTEWSFQHFEGNSNNEVKLAVAKTDLEKAHQYLDEKKMDEAANCLRKATEEMAICLRVDYANKPIEIGVFQSLSKNLGISRNKLHSQIPHALYDRFKERLAQGTFDQKMYESLKTLILPKEWQAFENVALIDEVLHATERVLNPGSHAGDAPLYEAEVKETLGLVEKFLASGNMLLATQNL